MKKLQLFMMQRLPLQDFLILDLQFTSPLTVLFGLYSGVPLQINMVKYVYLFIYFSLAVIQNYQTRAILYFLDVIQLFLIRCATGPGVEGLNPGRLNQINHVSSMKM